jgi:hypothetical protein
MCLGWWISPERRCRQVAANDRRTQMPILPENVIAGEQRSGALASLEPENGNHVSPAA